MPTVEPPPPSSAAPEPQPYLPSGWRRVKAETEAEQSAGQRQHASYAFLAVYGVLFVFVAIVALVVLGLLWQVFGRLLLGGGGY